MYPLVMFISFDTCYLWSEITVDIPEEDNLLDWNV